MNAPKIARCFAGFAAAASLLLACAPTVRAQAQPEDPSLYTAFATPANPQAGSVHFLQLVTLTPGTGPFTITSFTLGVNFTAGTTDQGFSILFYTGVDQSSTAVSALATATFIGGASGVLQTPGTANTNTTYTFFLPYGSVASPTSNVVGAEVFLTDSTGANFSDDLSARYTATGPSVGSAPGYVWNDANLDNDFSGAEQTRFNQTNAYARLALNGTVPEPGTWAMIAVGLVAMAFAARRRLA